MAPTEPPSKKAKTDEAAAVGESKTTQGSIVQAEVKPLEELEKDAPKFDKTKCIKDAVIIRGQDTTLNAMLGTQPGILSTLSNGSLQNLAAGVRTNTGVKAGRYMFEVKVLQVMPKQESQRGGNQAQSFLRVGFSTDRSSLYAGETADSVCFDVADGNYMVDRKKTRVGKRLLADGAVLAVVLNLDSKAQNVNTVSLFCDGERICAPQALPDSLKGKALFPTITYRSVSVFANFGSMPLLALPFKCRTIAEATATDATVLKASSGKDGKFEVVFPIGIPDEGVFDWADTFLKNKPDYTELSHRIIVDMAKKSGFNCNVNAKDNAHCNQLDTNEIHRILQNISTLLPRNFLVLELKSNLMEADRAENLSRFPSQYYTKVAHVLVGDPSPDFKKRTQELNLERKQNQSDLDFKKEQNAKKMKKQQEKKTKEMERKRKKSEKEKKKAEAKKKKELAEFQKKRKEEQERKKAEAAGTPLPEKTEEEQKEEPEVEESEEEAVEESDVEVEEQPPKVTLTAEEKAELFFKHVLPDLSPDVMGRNFMNFSIPEKSEGFDDIKFEWSKKDKRNADDHLKKWVIGKKLSTRVEDLKISAWFQQELQKFNKQFTTWKGKVNEYKNMLSKKAAAKKAKENAKKQAEAKKAAKAAAQTAKAKKREDDKAAGKEVPDEEEEEEEEAVAIEDEEEETEVNLDDVDIFGEADICNVGGGKPLFYDFANEDWTMVQLRFELHLLVHAFRRDCNDADRTGIFINHLQHYYNLYFKKELKSWSFGKENMEGLIQLVHDTVFLTSQQVMEPMVDAELEQYGVFVRITEAARRMRLIMLDLGDETARLKLNSGHGGNHGNQQQQKTWVGKQQHQQPNKGGSGGWGQKNQQGQGSQAMQSILTPGAQPQSGKGKGGNAANAGGGKAAIITKPAIIQQKPGQQGAQQNNSGGKGFGKADLMKAMGKALGKW